MNMPRRPDHERMKEEFVKSYGDPRNVPTMWKMWRKAWTAALKIKPAEEPQEQVTQ